MQWDPDFLAHSPLFEPLRTRAPDSFNAQWPGLPALQSLLDRQDPPVRVAGGALLRVVPQVSKAGRSEVRYEERIYRRGELQVRANDWHDLFNLLVWLTFPRAKAALNARHHAAFESRASTGVTDRGPVEDALTLFDEGGVIVAATSRELLDQLRTFAWKELFWRNREAVVANMRFFLFGHALYEKALRPFAGITGRGLCFDIDPGFLRAPPAVQLAEMDARVADHIGATDRLTATRDLAPVPILGVPGWCAENTVESYYDDTNYFRPRPKSRER
ncbi:MAG: DUF3025 domain-containing protein [Betaproteobacteria bacterium]|nr:DUF3025 domain-containing protein [Betaproteobacteria bacterium]MDH3436388.1 DUF3025 domain-containing protein [Betaproteobacteria bacterium]